MNLKLIQSKFDSEAEVLCQLNKYKKHSENSEILFAFFFQKKRKNSGHKMKSIKLYLKARFHVEVTNL